MTKDYRGKEYKSKGHRQALARFKRIKAPCAICGSRDNQSVDHILPVSRGGRSNPENLRCLCVSCNARRGAGVRGWRSSRF